MQPSRPTQYSQTEQLLADLRVMRGFTGPVEEFWPEYLQACGRLAIASRAMLLTQDPSGKWVPVAAWPPCPPGPPLDAELVARAIALAPDTVTRGRASSRAPKARPAAGALTTFRLDEGPGLPIAVVALAVPDAPTEQLEAATLVLRLTADIPASYLKERALRENTGDTLRFAEAFDLMVLLNQDQRFVKATLTACNELAARYRCSRVSLGWVRGDYVRLETMSHVEKFERRTTAVQLLEAAMEEASEQDEDVVVPATPAGHVTRAHVEYAREVAVPNVASLPLRLADDVVGVLTCERLEAPFSDDELRGLRLALGQATRRLADLERTDRWFGARLALMVHDSLAWALGPENTLAKVAVLGFVALVAFVGFGTLDYRIDAPFILKTDDLAGVPAPFDGYIHEAKVRVGDEVKQGDVMAALDARELLLEEASATAEVSRYTWEAEKQRSRGELVDMKISQALRSQAQARFDKVHFNLENAKVKAPFAGVVVEGDLKKMLGAPVRKGDMLFKVARIERMYAEIDLPERDVRELRTPNPGHIVFVSRPDETFPILTDPPDPVAAAREGENVFTVRANPQGKPAAWWRPGMSGVAKLDGGRRNVGWLLTHRAIDYLRLWAWW